MGRVTAKPPRGLSGRPPVGANHSTLLPSTLGWSDVGECFGRLPVPNVSVRLRTRHTKATVIIAPWSAALPQLLLVALVSCRKASADPEVPDDGTLAIDNNAVERAIRPLVLGRKNWLFAGSDAGGERAAAAIYAHLTNLSDTWKAATEILRLDHQTLTCGKGLTRASPRPLEQSRKPSVRVDDRRSDGAPAVRPVARATGSRAWRIGFAAS